VARRTLILAAVLIASLLVPLTSGAQPFQQDPLGPISDVTSRWRHYQPAAAFCVKPSLAEYASGGVGATATGKLPVCRRSGFPASAKGLVLVHIRTPELCPGCRRLFIDFSKIPRKNAPPNGDARGHVYYHLDSFNWTFTVDPIAHSPNTKNFTNDKLLVPDGSPQQPVVNGFDLHAIAYVSDTADFVHTKSQGPYYAGPWYLNRAGQRIEGVYLDVDVADATRYPDPTLNAIGYIAGFDTGTACPSDGDGYYGGCVDWWGMSASTVDPYAKP
jgi:hypothetical protein